MAELSSTPLAPAASGSVLLIGSDPVLVGDVVRLAAAAGVVPETVADPGEALTRWTRAALVLVAGDSAEPLARLKPGRRPGVHVVCRGEPADGSYRDALVLGAESIADLPRSETWLVELLTDAGDGAAPQATTIGVLGGSGGVGASVFAAALAESAAITRDVLLVDADPLGAGLDRVLGMEDVEGIRWDVMAQSTGRLSGRSMRSALPRRGGLGVLTWPPDDLVGLQATAVREVLSAGVRGYQLVVVDLPRHPDPVAAETLSRCDHLVLVAAASVSGVAAATRVVRRLPAGVPAHLVVRRQRAGVPDADVAAVLGLPLLAAVGTQRGLSEALDLGVGPLRSARGPIARACYQVSARLLPEPS